MPTNTRILETITIVRRSNGTFGVFQAAGGGFSCGGGSLRSAVAAVMPWGEVREALREAIDLAIDAHGIEPAEISVMVAEVAAAVARRDAESQRKWDLEHGDESEEG